MVPIAKILESAKVYWVNWWNKPDDVKVTDYKYFIAHITFDSLGTGYFNATELFKTFKTPSKGKIIALQGQLANTPAIVRFKGLQKALAENPGVQLAPVGRRRLGSDQGLQPHQGDAGGPPRR